MKYLEDKGASVVAIQIPELQVAFVVLCRRFYLNKDREASVYLHNNNIRGQSY